MEATVPMSHADANISDNHDPHSADESLTYDERVTGALAEERLRLLEQLEHFEIVALDHQVLRRVPVLRVLEVGLQRRRGRPGPGDSHCRKTEGTEESQSEAKLIMREKHQQI